MINSQEILMFYEMFDDDDISTERLLAMVADAANCCVSDVADVLFQEHKAESKPYKTVYMRKRKKKKKKNGG